MKKRNLYFIPLIIFLVIGIALPVIFSHSIGTSEEMVQDNGYYIKSYNVEIDVGQDGVYTVYEDIAVHFNVNDRHGIYRYLPVYQTAYYYNNSGKLVSKNYKSTISNFKCWTDKVVASYEGDFEIYRFGSAGITFDEEDEHTYSFSYKIAPGDDRDNSMDMFYFNIIGSGWDTSIENVTFTITFPKKVEDNFKFYVGKYGQSADDSSRITHNLSADGKVLTGYINDGLGLGFGQAITAFTSLENGYFKYSRSYVFDIVMIVAIVLCGAVLLFMLIKHKQKTPVVPVVNFSAPKGMTPTEVGYLNDEEITGDDLSALIIYWASKGCVKIIEKDKNITIQKLKDLPSGSKKHEEILFKDMFRNGDKVSANNLNLSLNTGYKCADSVEKEMSSNFSNSKSTISKCQTFMLFAIFFLFVKSVFQSYLRGGQFVLQGGLYILLLAAVSFIGVTVQNRYKRNAKKFWTILSIEVVAIYGLLIAFMCLIEGYTDPFFTRIIIAILPAIYLILLLTIERYSKEGKRLLGEIRGLKAFIETAEKDRMEMLVNENPNLFFEVLPYAYVLGVSDVYMKKFENVDIIKPDWYESSSPRFTYVHFVYLNRSFGSISQACTTRYRSQSTGGSISSHSSSGFGGGGGFSGGGFGGGGGGSW